MRSGAYDDWHPPVMARLWSLFDAAGIYGTAPLFVVQTLLFYAGIGLAAAALPRLRPAVAIAAGIALLIPAGWMTVVIKDAQMVAALVLATGLVAAFRLRGRALPGVAVAAVAVLLIYAVLLRANAVFAVVPLTCAWAGWGGVRSLVARAALMLVATLAILGVSPLVNHRLLGARASHVERVLPLYDLAGIAHFGGIQTVPRLPVARWREAEARGCYSAYRWDDYGDAARCDFVADAAGLEAETGAPLIGEWARAVAAHPLKYARHRLGHFNATMRWLVPFGQPNAAAPPDSQPNTLGLGRRVYWGTCAPSWVDRAVAATPLGWPAVWLAASLGLWRAAAGTPRGPARDLALALFASASLMSLSFAVVSIAADLRYHLWAIVATTFGAVLLAGCEVPRRRVAMAAGAVGLVAAAGVVARLVLVPGTW